MSHYNTRSIKKWTWKAKFKKKLKKSDPNYFWILCTNEVSDSLSWLTGIDIEIHQQMSFLMSLLEGDLSTSQIPKPQSFGASHRPKQPGYLFVIILGRRNRHVEP